MNTISYDDNVKLSLERQQLNDLEFLKKELESIIYSWNSNELKSVLEKYNDALANCDSIDYQDFNTVMAYVSLHLLDRYHRFQLMQRILLKNNILTHYDKNKINILDVGTGPAPALMAFSDFYEWLGSYSGVIQHEFGDYVEQSKGFRTFLHFFCEYVMKDNKTYHIPFHNGSFADFGNFKLENRIQSHRDLCVNKYRYNVVIFSNFLTNRETLVYFEDTIKKVLMSIRNYGLVIIVGACPTSIKYAPIYEMCDKIINKKFNNREYRGYWNKVVSVTFNEKYSEDEQGKMVHDYFQILSECIKEQNMWDSLEKNVQRTLLSAYDENDVTQWEMVVYQKHVWKKTYKKSMVLKNQ